MTRWGVVVRLCVLALLVAAPALLDTYNTFLLTEILIFGLFAASLDLLIGYSGLPSLGHGGYYGVGAYAAGLLALHATTNAFAQIAVATGVAAAAALATGFFAVRSRGVYFVMLTLAFGQLLWVLALNWTSLTAARTGFDRAPTPVRGLEAAPSTDHHWYVVCVFLVGYRSSGSSCVAVWLCARGDPRERSRAASLGYNVQPTSCGLHDAGAAPATRAPRRQQPKYFLRTAGP
jgi:branched-chain amino acid transport system permease protein